MSFRILTVCTGNICRSPTAALLLTEALSPYVDVEVISRGTKALIGQSMPIQAQQLIDGQRTDPSLHTARQVDEESVITADLILTMAREHRRSVVSAYPTTLRRAFTLREFAAVTRQTAADFLANPTRQGSETVEERMREGIAFAASMRGTIPPPSSSSEFDVVDPYGRPDDIYRASFEEIRPAVDQTARFLLSVAGV